MHLNLSDVDSNFVFVCLGVDPALEYSAQYAPTSKSIIRRFLDLEKSYSFLTLSTTPVLTSRLSCKFFNLNLDRDQ